MSQSVGGFTRSRRTFRRRRRGSGRRKLIWKSSTFVVDLIGASEVVEFSLATEAELASLSLSKGTVAVIYGEIKLTVDQAEALDDVWLGAWGICLKEADAAASTSVFSPIADSDSSVWQTWRGISLVKTIGAGIWSQGNVLGEITYPFVIRNPRKVGPHEELVMVIEGSSVSEGTCAVCFWCRVGILLP